MRVIIEGPDGCGKSTLADYLVEKYGLTAIHSTADTPNDLQYHIDLLSNDNVVLDRANLGEIVFPILHHRDFKMSFEDQEKFMQYCNEHDVIYIVFYDSTFEVLKDRLFSRGDNEWVLKHAEIMNYMFMELALRYSEQYDNVFALDISKVSDQIKFFERRKGA